MIGITAPTNCPACDFGLVFKNDVLYCLNTSCTAKTQKGLQHWAKTMKIKGLGPQSLLKLDINSITDLYNLTITDLESALGAKIGTKIYEELQNSTLAPLEIVLPAFGIPLIGNSATSKLQTHIVSLDELTYEKARESGLGPKAATSLLDWFVEAYSPLYRGVLPFSFKFTEAKTKKEITAKGVVCITGKLSTYKTKSEAEKALRECGFDIKSSLTKDVTILVNESGIESAKTKKARESGITVVDNIKQLTGE